MLYACEPDAAPMGDTWIAAGGVTAAWGGSIGLVIAVILGIEALHVLHRIHQLHELLHAGTY